MNRFFVNSHFAQHNGTVFKLFCHKSNRYFAKNAQTKSSKNNEHNPSIMQNEILHIFNSKYPNGTFLDASFGEGGHSINLIKSSYNNKVIGLDCDHTISRPTARFLEHKYRESNRFKFIHSKWSKMYPKVREKLFEISKCDKLDGILLESGFVSTHEKSKKNGLVFDAKLGELDMRYFTINHFSQKNDSLAVWQLFEKNRLTVECLTNILSIFGDQNDEICARMAQALMFRDDDNKMRSIQDLVFTLSKILNDDYKNCNFLFIKRKSSLIRNDHPIKKTLNAFVRFINNSFIELSLALRQSELLLKENGSLIIICYDHLESRIICEFLKTRNLLNMHSNNVKMGEATYRISNEMIYLKQRNEALGEHNWHGIGEATFNDFNAVPFVQAHVGEISSHSKGKYARMLVLERTKAKSIENEEDFMMDLDDLAVETLKKKQRNLSELIEARNERTKELLSYPSHNHFVI